MKDDAREKRWRERLPRLVPRIALLVCIAVVVISLGVVLTPGSPKAPADPPFSEQARAAALSETLRLRAAGAQLGSSAAAAAPGSPQGRIAQAVSLLTEQARALLAPGGGAAAGPLQGSPSPAATPPAGSEPDPDSPAALAAALSASGSKRLAEAAAADGGMARLLAAVGTAQLLEASSLAAATGSPAPATPDPAAPALAGSCPAPPGTAPAGATGPAGASAGASLEGALTAAVRTEMEIVYGYQVALTRLGGGQYGAAAQQLARHETLVSGAEALARAHCVPAPPREAGYTLDQSFLASPAAGLGRLEAAALPVYGDLIALSGGETRQWAIAGLVGSARRAALWGAAAGSLPGLAADPASFPPLPTPSASPGTTR